MSDQDSWFRRGMVQDVTEFEREEAKRGDDIQRPALRDRKEGEDEHRD